jgi:GntR family transcriptional repressor for pyruvate dehydrogenase complex
VAADIAFHFGIATAAGNQSLLRIMRSIRGLLQVWITRVMHSAGASRPTWEEHAAVLRAIEARDVAGAQRAMEAHMSAATARLERTLEEHAAPGDESPLTAQV